MDLATLVDSLESRGNVVRDDFPIANSNYVGDASGPHIDSKVKRRILREQRLFFALTAVGWDGERREVQSLGPSQGEIHAYLDLRIFGKMMRGKNCFGVLNIARGAGGLMTPCIFPLIALDNGSSQRNHLKEERGRDRRERTTWQNSSATTSKFSLSDGQLAFKDWTGRGSWSTSRGQHIDTMASRSVSGIGRRREQKRKCGGEDTSNVS